MSCVNKSSKEFKTLAANNNISSNTLELITHKYWLETGSEENLPTDVYIQAQLGNGQYKETIPEVRELWQKRYNHPITYTSYQELQKGLQEASNFFPQNAVFYYKDSKGNYILSVKQPVERVYDTADDFFSQDWSSAKTLDLGLDENQTYGIDKVQELFNRFNNDRTSKFLADKVFALAKDLGLQVTFNNELPFGKTGRTTNNATITYKKSFLERDLNTDKKAPLLLHEAIHAITMYALSESTKNQKRSKELEQFKTDINQIFNEVRFNKALEGERGIHDVNEFTAELANPIFRQKLQNIDTGKKKSIWSKIVDAIKNLLGIHSGTTYYQRSMNALEKALNAFDLDSWLAYNGLKSPLQKAYNEHRVDFENMSEDELKSMLKATIQENSRLNNKEQNNEQNIRQGIQRGGKGLQEVLRILNRKKQQDNAANAGVSNESKGLRERSHEEAARQQKLIRDWAEKNGKLIVEPNDYYDETIGDKHLSGTESKVWIDSDRNVVIKSISPNHYPNLKALLERIAIHNKLFPETAMTLQNVGISDDGISIIVEQPRIINAGDVPSLKEIEDYMLSQGFTHTKGKGINAEYTKNGYLVTDIRPENVIKQPNGELAVIDCFAKIDENAQTNSEIDNLASLIDNMSREQIVDELKKVRQEYADYDIVSDNPEDFEERRPRKSTFTFSDGTTVNTPFTPNSQQAEALNVMNDFIHSNNETTMTLSGYAGTGKTSLMEIIAQKAMKDNNLIMFCATTNKATAVLKSKVSRIGFDAQTLNKMFGINVEVDTNSSYDARNLVNKLRDVEIPYGTTIVIDEASMINEENYNILKDVIREKGLKIIYVGDRGQLAPVNENKVSKVFRNSDGKVIELTKVERTDDNAILKEATDIRNGKPMSMQSSFNDEGKGVAFINPKGENKQVITDVIKYYVKGLKKDPDYFRILAYTNKAVAQYNNFVRRQLGFTDNIPRTGEPIVGYTNWGYNWRSKTYDFINSESYKVIKVGKQIEKSFEIKDQKVRMSAIPITLENSLGEQKTFDFIDIKGNNANRTAAEILASMKKKLWARARTASKAAKRDIYAQINAIDKFLFVNDNIMDSQGHYLQTKTFDFGYALTVHKSQGSTFSNVLMDDNDISKAHDEVTRDTDEYNGTWEINLDDGSIVPVSDDASITRTSDKDIAHIKQQLEYVAMSRATDTVTVITDNAQKEDSPLNHLKEKDAEKPVQETPRPQVPVTPERPVSDRFRLNPQRTEQTNESLTERETSYNEDSQKQMKISQYKEALAEQDRSPRYTWSRDNAGYEVSTAGDKRYSALVATFKEGTKWDGQDIGGKTIEWVYQNLIKKSRKGQPPAKDSILYNESLKTKEEREDFSYEKGYLPLWRLWAEQHPELINELYRRTAGHYALSDKFANTRVSQARALAEILNDKYRSDVEKSLAELQSDNAINSQENRSYNGMINITQNASGRLGSFDKADEDAFNNAKRTLRNSKALKEDIQNAVKTLNEIYDKKEKEIQAIFKDVIDLTGAKFSLVKAADSWQGAGEYSFKIKVEAPTKAAYNKTILAVSWIAEGARQDAFIENRGIADRSEVSRDSLLSNKHTPTITIPFNHSLSQAEIAQIEAEFETKSTKDVPLDATVTKDEITFSMPTWKIEQKDGENADDTYKRYKELYNNWKNKIKEVYQNGQICRRVGRRISQQYERIRFRGANSTEGNTREYSNFRNSYLSGQRGLGENENQSQAVGREGTLTEEEGQRIKKNAEQLFGLEEGSTQRPIDTGTPPPSAPNTSITIQLPGYEWFNDLYEDTVIDAQWKEPYLKELDGQLSTDNTTEENNEILQKMNDIFKANTEEDIQGQHSLEKEKEIQHDMDEYDKLNTQFDNLLEGNFADEENGNINELAKELDDDRIKFRASEVRHVAELLGNYLSDMITRLQTEDGAVEKLFPELKFEDNPDFSKMSRIDIVRKIGIDNLIARAKYDFDPQNSVIGIDDMITSIKAQLVVENWDAMMLLASDVFSLNEGFGIKRDYQNSRFSLNESKNQVAYDDFNGYQDEEDIEEKEGDSQEHWQVESMTIDVLDSMSALVRQAIHECYVLDNDGNKVIDENWNLPLRVSPRKATNSILRWVQGSASLEDMVKKLSDKQGKNPWLQQLIKRLSDKSGNEADFQSQFYNVFTKPFQLYSIVRLENGKYSTMPVNSHPALSEAMNSIITQFKMGEHPLFTTSGKIRAELLQGNKNDPSVFSLHSAHAVLKDIMDRLNHSEELSKDMVKEAAKNLSGAYKILGYPVSEEMVSEVLDVETFKDMTFKLGYINKALDSQLAAQRRTAGTPNTKAYDPFGYGKDNNIGGTLRNFLKPVTDSLEDTAISAFYDSGKMYQSYVTPSFMTKLMTKFKTLEGKDFEEFIENNYSNSEWFAKRKGRVTHWNNRMLQQLATDQNARDVFDFKVELNFNKHNYMRNMTDSEYTLSLITEYYGESKEKDNVPAWFRMPMQSNKPSSEFFKFYSYRRYNYKDTIVNQLSNMFFQEVDRIKTVRMRNLGKNDIGFIKNFDTNGRKFNFLPFLNSYLMNTAVDKANRTVLRNSDGTIDAYGNSKLATLVQKVTDSTVQLSSEEKAELSALVNKAIRAHMEDRVAEILDSWDKSGIIEAARSIKNIVVDDALLKEGEELAEGEDKNEYVRQSLENYLWNDYLATKNILQLTVGDIAFYKDAEDLQKRLAQLHAPGTRANIYVTDYNGNRVSDGKYRTLILKDFDYYISNIIDNITEVFDRQITRASDNEKPQLMALKESLVGKNGKYRNINVADAQGYSSPSSYRKKALMFGKWSRHAEEIYQKLLKGEYTYTDLETAFQPLKPFVYTHLQKNIGSGNSPIKTMHVPFQAKNSEYLLIMADAIIRGETLRSGKLSRPNLLRAIYNVMEDSAFDGRVRDSKTGKILKEGTYNGRGIDTVQFESAIKSGLQGAMNIEQFANMEGGEAATYSFMMNQVYKTDDKGIRTTEYDTDNFVHEASFEDYCLQQEVPEHFKNHSQAHGSQIRMITPSDLDLYIDPSKGDVEGNINYYEWTDPDGTKRRVRADEFKKEYENTIADNIKGSIDNLYREFKLDSMDKRERNIALSKILQREILSSPRYGVDLLQACSVDKKTGEFRIPKGDPIQAKRIEQLINSIIKNRVNKQKIAGGPIVQVTNFGTSQQLHIRFNDRQGGLLKTKDEFLKDDSLVSQYKTYGKYTEDRQAGIAYFEVFLPLWSNEIYDKFADENGNIDMEALDNADPELTKMVSYRIPTEDKYSTAPMKAVGFMPREAGDAIMLPYELTEIDDSDFDVDKRYVMRKELNIKRKRTSEIFNTVFDRVNESYKSQHDSKELKGSQKQFYKDIIDQFISIKNADKYKTGDKFVWQGKDVSSFARYLNSIYRKVAYTTEQPKDIKIQRNNKIVDMTMAVLTNEMTADKILNPGGFDAPKKVGYMVAAYKNAANQGTTWQQLQKMSIDELKDLSYTAKDLAWADTQVQFYRQNSASSNLIGVFAVNKVAHAVLESDGIFIDVDEICGKEPFTIAGMIFGGRMEIDGAFDTEGNRIGKTLGSMVSASADGVKDPVLNLMNINMTTANVLNTMLRLGMPFDKAALFLSQDVIGRLLSEFNNRNLTNYVSLDSLIKEYIAAFEKKYDVESNSNIRTEGLTESEMVKGLLPTEHEATDYKVILALQKLMSLSSAMRNPTFATRFNSISSSVGPLIIDNLILEHKRDQFLDSNSENGTTHFYNNDGNKVDIDNIFYDHPVLREFARSIDIAKELFKDMPAGSEKFRDVLSSLPSYISDKIYGDKKLLSQLSDFFQSYLLVASHLVDPTKLKDYIEKFPKEFNDKNYKEKYPNNALIQAIQLTMEKDRPVLKIKITGMDTVDKEELSSAWIDLHRENPELSKKLFIYNFFRAGIGFSPKTFMALVPMYVKEHLQEGNATYVDTFRNLPDIIPETVIDQFIRNNWNNNKLVPWKGGKGSKFKFDYRNGILTVDNPDDIAKIGDATYIKTQGRSNAHLWKLVASDSSTMVFEEVSPLGNNGEYLEMSTSEIDRSVTDTKKPVEDNSPSDLADNGSVDEESTTVADTRTNTQKSHNMAEFTDLVMKQMIEGYKGRREVTKEDAANRVGEIKEKPKKFAKFLVNVFKQKGLDLNEEQALEEFNKYC